ncbi:MAG: BrnA antitoxin family protein [Mesorhizobium sp.]|nr:BrnA antitoxin family protein [Mesorhizobium sp.]MCO5163616.1 BrnA antitoxin family protein [Mesorhizobium sp.]
MKTVEHRRDTLPELTDERRRALEKLAAQPDDAIDTNDIPDLADEQWAGAVRGRFYRPIKQQITARVDADVLAWLKADGRGYQTRLNTILRGAMERELGRKGQRG